MGAPAPCVEPEDKVEPQKANSPLENGVGQIQADSVIVQEQSQSSVIQEPQSSSCEEAEHVAAQSSSNVSEILDTVPAQPPKKAVIDPYTAFPALASDVFEYADSLYAQGNTDEAIAYLKRFRIIKPLWAQWENQADSMLAEYGKANEERVKQFEPLILEMQNMNRVKSAYSMVAEVADSLIAMEPGDSLEALAREQKRIAYRNTLEKGLKEKEMILALAEQEARFDEALKQAESFLLRYRDFEAELQPNKLINHIQQLKNSTNLEDQEFWKKHDAEKALADVDKLIDSKSYDKAKDLIEKLKASKLRQEALVKYQKLADAYCTEKRKATSQLFQKASKKKDEGKKKNLLREAIAALNSCLEEYPDYTKIKTVTDNILFLKKELDR